MIWWLCHEVIAMNFYAMNFFFMPWTFAGYKVKNGI